jgi:histidinol-phosphate aminotransferase
MTVLDALVREEQLSVGTYEVPRYDDVRIRMDANESPYSLDPDIAAGLGAELARVATNRYPDSQAAELRRHVCADLGVSPDQIVFGNGSQDLIVLVVGAFSRPRAGVADGRARVLYPTPSFVGYPLAARFFGVVPVEVPLCEDFELDPVALERAFTATRPNVAFFGLPNNPTGTLWPRAEIERVLAAHRDTVIVADEAYFEYSGETLLDLLPAYPNLLVLRTLSKLGMAAIRVGFVIGAPGLVAHIEKIRPPFNIGSLNQAAASWLLAHHRDRLRERVASVVRERERLLGELARLPDLKIFPSRANYILCRYGVPGDRGATALCEQLHSRGIVVRNFDGAGALAGCFRATIGTPDENRLFLDALRRIVGV